MSRRNQPQNVGEQIFRNGNLGHLERDVAAMADDRGRKRPVFDRLGRRQRAQKVAEIVGQRMKLETDGFSSERPT